MWLLAKLNFFLNLCDQNPRMTTASLDPLFIENDLVEDDSDSEDSYTYQVPTRPPQTYIESWTRKLCTITKEEASRKRYLLGRLISTVLLEEVPGITIFGGALRDWIRHEHLVRKAFDEKKKPTSNDMVIPNDIDILVKESDFSLIRKALELKELNYTVGTTHDSYAFREGLSVSTWRINLPYHRKSVAVKIDFVTFNPPEGSSTQFFTLSNLDFDVNGLIKTSEGGSCVEGLVLDDVVRNIEKKHLVICKDRQHLNEGSNFVFYSRLIKMTTNGWSCDKIMTSVKTGRCDNKMTKLLCCGKIIFLRDFKRTCSGCSHVLYELDPKEEEDTDVVGEPY